MSDTSTEPDPVVAAARIRYHDDQPYSLDYQDIYHAGDGAAEVRRTFLGPCELERVARDSAARGDGPGNTVRVGELGFGSGLNFVLAAEACQAAGARLHFVSFEAHPIAADDFAAIAARRAPAHPLYRELAAVYPPCLGGWHRRYLGGGRICLTLWWGPAEAGLADIAGRQRQPFDAWFLDGFAPDRNPDMWSARTLGRLAETSGRGTRVATFTAAGRVRRGLEAAGFAMRRVDQRPYKRETLAGAFAAPGLPGFRPPEHVAIAGAGLAGASAAWHLARAGCRVTIHDPGGGTPASGIPASVLHGRLLGDASPQGGLRSLGFLYAASLVRAMPGFRATGVLRLPGSPREADKLQRIAARYGPSGPWVRWLAPEEAAAVAGWPVASGALHFADGGVVDLPALCRALLDEAGAQRIPERLATPPADRPLVLACGSAVGDFAAARYLEVAPVHGQLDVVALDAPPRVPLVGAGYLVPHGRTVAAGATYEYRPWDEAEATRANLAQLGGRPHRWLDRRRGTRTVSSDRTAIAGALYRPDGTTTGQLYVSTGHGSLGNVSTHLAGAVIAAAVVGDCPPLARPLEAALSPWRFHPRQARRGLRHGARPPER